MIYLFTFVTSLLTPAAPAQQGARTADTKRRRRWTGSRSREERWAKRPGWGCNFGGATLGITFEQLCAAELKRNRLPLRGTRENRVGQAVFHGNKPGHLGGWGGPGEGRSRVEGGEKAGALASHSCKNRRASSAPTALCRLNSSFTYWSPRALRSGGSARCSSKMRRYKARTRETCAAGIAPRGGLGPQTAPAHRAARGGSAPGIGEPAARRKWACDL